MAKGTIVWITTRLNTIIKNSIAEGIITSEPFESYVAERPERVRKYLSQQELKALMTTPLAKSYHYLIRDLFLLSCYIGIPYSDMCKLTNKELELAQTGNFG